MDFYLPVDRFALSPGEPIHWRDVQRSEPIEIEEAGEEPLSLEAAKAHLKVTIDDDDALIGSGIPMVRRQVEYDLGYKLVEATLEMAFDRFPIEPWLTLPLPPVKSVVSLSSFSFAGVETVMDQATYLADSYSAPGRVLLVPGAVWPTGTRPFLGAKIRWVAGPASAHLVDRSVHAMKLLLGHFYENREAVTSGTSRYAPDVFPIGYDALISGRIATCG